MPGRSVLVVALLLGCGAAPEGGLPEPRVVSLVPAATEIIFALGAGDHLVGNTTFCDYPEAARAVYKVGDFQMPDLERILSRNPHLVVLTLPVHAAIAERLTGLDVRWHASDPQNVASILIEIDSLGRLLGRVQRATVLVDSLRSELAAVPAAEDTPAVYVEISDVPLMTVGDSGFMGELLSLAGGRNIYGGIKHAYPVVESEFVVTANPEVILLLYPVGGAGEVAKRIGWGSIAAVRHRRIVADVDQDLVMRPGPRFVDGVRELHRAIHGR